MHLYRPLVLVTIAIVLNPDGTDVNSDINTKWIYVRLGILYIEYK